MTTDRKKPYAERERDALLQFALSVYTDPASSSEDRDAARERLIRVPGTDEDDDWPSQVSLAERQVLLAAIRRIMELKRGNASGEPLYACTARDWRIVELLQDVIGSEGAGINYQRLPPHEAEFLRAAAHRIARLRMYFDGYAGRSAPVMWEEADPPLRMMTRQEAQILAALRLTPRERQLALAAGDEQAEAGTEQATELEDLGNVVRIPSWED